MSGPEDVKQAHDFAVEEVLFHHDDVDSLRVLEREEAESARSTCGAIAHDCAFEDLSELREVVVKRIYRSLLVEVCRVHGNQLTICRLPVQTADEHFPIQNSCQSTSHSNVCFSRSSRTMSKSGAERRSGSRVDVGHPWHAWRQPGCVFRRCKAKLVDVRWLLGVHGLTASRERQVHLEAALRESPGRLEECSLCSCRRSSRLFVES